MVGPTPEGNSVNMGERNLHNAGKISTPSAADKRNFGGTNRGAAATQRNTVRTLIPQMNTDY